MFDRVEICPQCGKSGMSFIFPSYSSTDGVGCACGILCHECGLYRPAMITWELSYRLLRRNLRFCRSRHSLFSGKAADWRPIPDFDTLGSNQLVAVRLQVTEMWPRLFPNILFGFPDDLVEPHDIKVFRHLMHETSGDLSEPAYTVRDFLALALLLGCDGCFGQPLAS